MAYGNNTNAPAGFKPNSFIGGSLWNGAVSSYPVASGYATSLFQGDPVAFLADGTIGIATAGAQFLGIFQGIQYTDASGNYAFKNRWIGGTTTLGAENATATVVDAKGVLFDGQVSTATGTPGPVNPVGLSQADIGQNIDFAVTANTFNPTVAPNPVTYAANPGSGSTITGISGYYLNYGAKDTTSTRNFKIIALTPVPGNVSSPAVDRTASGTLNFNNALVEMNNQTHTSAGTTGI